MIKWNSTYNETNFTNVDLEKSLPPCEGGYCHGYNISEDCLFTDGRSLHIGCCTVEMDDGFIDSIAWYSGSESFKIENVTHWANLPDLPQE